MSTDKQSLKGLFAAKRNVDLVPAENSNCANLVVGQGLNEDKVSVQDFTDQAKKKLIAHRNALSSIQETKVNGPKIDFKGIYGVLDSFTANEIIASIVSD